MRLNNAAYSCETDAEYEPKFINFSAEITTIKYCFAFKTKRPMYEQKWLLKMQLNAAKCEPKLRTIGQE